MAKESDSKKIDYIQTRVDSVADTVASIDKTAALHKAALDDHIEQDAKTNDRMYNELCRLNNILQQNTDSLKEHMYRSDLLENLVEKMDKRFSPIEIEFLRKQAVRDWVMIRVKFTAKLGAAIGALGAIWVFAEPVLKLIVQYLGH